MMDKEEIKREIENKKEIKKQKLEIKSKTNPDGTVTKAIFIGGEMFDYSVDMKAYHKACEMGDKYQKYVQEDITRHFTESVSEFLERKVTMADIVNAFSSGWI